MADCLQKIYDLRNMLKASDTQQLEDELEESLEHITKLQTKIEKMTRLHNKQMAEAVLKTEQLEAALNTEQTTKRPMSESQAQTDAITLQGEDTQSESIHKLERDVFYYRNANKELKSKLREIVAVNHRLAKSVQQTNPEANDSSYSENAPIARAAS